MGDEIDGVIAKLSDKMRFNIVSARETIRGDFITRAYMHIRESKALRDRGLTEAHAFNCDRLSKLGLAVRARLSLAERSE